VQGSDLILGDEFHIDDFDTPVRLEQAVGMLSNNERFLLYKLARDHFLAKGHIVDAGSFFGSSTVSLAEGPESQPLFEGGSGSHDEADRLV
jgi:hypothetical protein